MQPQSFFAKTGDDGMASYQVIIPVLNMADGYSLRVKAEDGADVPCTAGENGEYVIDRKDGEGKFKATVALVDARGTVCDERLIEISSSRGPVIDPRIMQAVVEVLEKNSVGSIAGGNAFADLQTKARGEDIAAVCEQYFRSDVTPDWRLKCLAYLYAAGGSPHAKNHAARMMDVIQEALGSDESASHTAWAADVGLRVNVPSPTRFSFLFRALQCSFSNLSLYQRILAAMANITPGSERPKVAAVASELLAQHTDVNLRIQALSLITVFGYRNALPVIREVLAGTTDINILRSIVPVLLSWNDTSSAPQLMEALDLTNDPTLAGMIMQALKQFGCRDAIPKIEAMMTVSGVDKARVLEAGLKGWK